MSVEAVFGKCETATKMKRQSSGGLHPLLLFKKKKEKKNPPLLSVSVYIWSPSKHTDLVGLVHFSSLLYRMPIYLFIYLDLMLVLTLVAVVHLLCHTHTPSQFHLPGWL